MIDRSYYVELFDDSDGSRDNHICSGIIIFERWIVTSGECVPRNNTQPWAFVGFRRYRGGGTSSTWVIQTSGTHYFDKQHATACKKNPLLIYELSRNVPDVTTLNFTSTLNTTTSMRPFIIGVSRKTDTSETLNLNFSKAPCGCGMNDDLCVSEINATGHADEHDSGAALLWDGNLVGVYSHRVNVNLLAFTYIRTFENWIMSVVGA